MLVLKWRGGAAKRFIQTHDWTEAEIAYGIHEAATAAYAALKYAIERARLDKSLVRARCPGCGGSGALGVGHCDNPTQCSICQCRVCKGTGLRPDAFVDDAEQTRLLGERLFGDGAADAKSDEAALSDAFDIAVDTGDLAPFAKPR